MKPRQPPAREPDGPFRTPLERFIDMNRPPVRLADRIDRTGPDAQVGRRSGAEARPGMPSRFMPGMPMPKAIGNLSDEDPFVRWSRDPHCRFFTGERYLRHHVPRDRSGPDLRR